MPGRRLRSTLLRLAVLLSASTLALAHDFESRPLAGTTVPVGALLDVIALDNGDVVLHERDANHRQQRYSRFDADGRFLGTTSLAGEHAILGASADSSLVSFECSSAHTVGHSPAGQLLWRFRPLLLHNHCSGYPFDLERRVGIDRDDRVWNLVWMEASTILAESGQLRSFDLSQIVATDASELSMYAWPTRSGAVIAANSLTSPQFAAIDGDGEVLWRHHTPVFAATRPGWLLEHHLFATSNRSGGVALTDVVSQHCLGFCFQYETLATHIAVRDAAGQLIWSKDAADGPTAVFRGQHLFADGTLAVLTGHQTGLRLRLFAADGTLLGDRTDNTVSSCEFIAPNGAHWALCAGFNVGKAISLDNDSSHDFTRMSDDRGQIVPRADGSALMFKSDRPPFRAEVFNGTGTTTTIEFPTSAFVNRFDRPYARRYLEHGDELLLRHNRISRSNSAGETLWSTPMANITRTDLIAGEPSQLLLVANHVCTVVGDPDRRVLCFNRTTGAPTVWRDLAGATTEKVRAVVRGDMIELLFRDSALHVRHWLLNMHNELEMSRDLGVGAVLWLDGDGALAQRFEDQALIVSNFAAAAPVVHGLPANSPLRTEQIVDRFEDGDWLSVGSTSTLFLKAAQVRRLDANFSQRWLREFPDVSAPATPVSNDATYLRVMLRDASGTERMQFLNAATGATAASPRAITPSTPLLFGPAGAFGRVREVNGTVVWQAWDALGGELASHAWRCPSACGSPKATIDGDQLTVIVSVDHVHVLTLEHPFSPRRAPHADDGAIAGVFTAANETNRGYVIDWLPSSRTLFVARFAGDTANSTRRELLDWETMQGVVSAGANEITLSRYRNADGRFAAADDAPITAFGTATFRIDGCDVAELALTDTSGTQPITEIVHLRRSGPRLKTCTLLDGTQIPAQARLPARGGFDSRQSGAWVASGASDQGLLAAVLPATADDNGVFFAPWFTYWSDAGANPGTANRHWLTLQGTLTPANHGSVALTIYRATAGSYGAVRPSNTHRIGTATWTLVDCEHAILDYQFDLGDLARPYAGRTGVQHYARPGACSAVP